VQWDKPNPFSSPEEKPASGGYIYKKWKFNEDLVLIARCEVDGLLKTSEEEPELLTIKAFNEFDPKISGVDWRQKLDAQRGAVLATELKSNSFKLARWTCQAFLAGSSQMKLGYVSRVHPKDHSNHVILGTQFYKPRELAAQINLSTLNCWGILKLLITTLHDLPNGKYVILKDPNRSSLHIYEMSDVKKDSKSHVEHT